MSNQSKGNTQSNSQIAVAQDSVSGLLKSSQTVSSSKGNNERSASGLFSSSQSSSTNTQTNTSSKGK
ncbi:hypothetical protein [Sulfurimonas sp.]|uniref:hypothetical protein n=1 Tax=Sulfurimonas sp. TaxID=2022749 RepID=UPI002AB12F77|nr:hypothetical protein [Sulfurimonas sp.]